MRIDTIETVYYVKVWEKQWDFEGSYVRDRIYQDRTYATWAQAEVVARALTGDYDNLGVLGVYEFDVIYPNAREV